MTLGDPSAHLTVQDVKGRVQAGCAMSLVIVSMALNLPGPQLQFWLGTIQSLNLRLFVNRQNQSIIGRVQIQTHHIKNLVGKVWIVADLERFQTVGLQICRLPDLLYLPTGYAGMFRHQPDAPMGGAARNLVHCVVENRFDLFLIELSWLPWSWGVLKTFEPCLEISVAPLEHGRAANLERLHDLLRRLPGVQQQ